MYNKNMLINHLSAFFPQNALNRDFPAASLLISLEWGILKFNSFDAAWEIHRN